MHKMTKACNVSKRVKQVVSERDGGKCILCGAYNAPANAHFIPRSAAGLGIEQNIVSLCQRCHYLYDNSFMRPHLREEIADYLRSKYPDWDNTQLTYQKGR